MSNKLPSVTSEIPRDLRTFIDRLREIITGNGSDRFVTAQDLINGGLAGAGTNGTLVPIKKGVIAPPPAPQNLTTTGSVNSIFVEWDNPTYYGHDYTEVYSSGTDVLGDAVLLGFTPGVNYVDTIGPQQSRYYWARFINTEGTAGPFNAVNGTLGQTGIEVEHMLQVLTGAITESQLYQDLGDKIKLIDGPTSLAGSVAARIYAEAQARLAADNTLGSSISTLQSSDSTQASQITTLQTRASTSESNIISLQSTTATQATTISSLTTRTAAAESNITNLQSTTATQASTLSTLSTRTTAAESSISNLQTTTANQASSISTLSTTVNGNTTAIQQEALTRSGETGNLFSKYTVKIDTNGYVSGFGLASEANNATPFSSFVVRADRFSISSPNGPGITPVTPFIVTTTSQTIDGTTVPAGVYIDGAYIKGGTIKGSAIEAGTITGTKLIDVSADKITGAALQATSYIESAAYIPGTQGWKIHANGTAEFAAASIRGQLTASQIDTRGLTIKDANGTVLFGSGTPLSYSSLTGTPVLGALAYQNTVSVSASNVSGLGSLATQNNVDWSTVINKPGFGNFAFLNTITQANISTYISGAAIGTAYIADAAITSAKILDGEITNAKIGSFIQSSNYSAGSSGWKIDKAGSAEFNDITVRSGQVIGALMTASKINSYVGLYVQINASNPISTTNGPYYLNGDTNVPQYLVYQSTMPAPATAAHKIAVVVNVQALASNTTKDLAVLVLVNAYISGQNIYASEQIAYNTNSGTYGICTNASGVTTNTYSTAVPCMVFVGGFNCAFTVQTIDGLAWGVR